MKKIIRSLAALLVLTALVGIQYTNAQIQILQITYKNGNKKYINTDSIMGIEFEYNTDIVSSDNDTIWFSPAAEYTHADNIISGDPITFSENCDWFDINLVEAQLDSTARNHLYYLYIKTAINDSENGRSAPLKIKSGNKEIVKTIYQHRHFSSFKYHDGADISPQREDDLYIEWNAGTTSIAMLPGFGIRLQSYPEWIKEIECVNEGEGVSKPIEENKNLYTRLKITTEDNLGTAPLTGTILLVDKDGEQLIINVTKNCINVSSVTSLFYNFGKLTSEGNHSDLFYAATMLFTDSRGMDMVSDDIGYNWFAASVDYSDISATSFTPYSIWMTAYNQIKAANDVVKAIGATPKESHLKYHLAQALAIRAFDYYTLAQYFQHTYIGNKNEPCVPIFTEVNADSTNCPRATVAEVYEQIMSDLDNAIGLLSNSETAREDKRYVDLAVAYGLRARVNLVMNNWAEAAADAQAAIDNTTAAPYDVEGVDHPTFSDIEDASWMWGILVAETDRPVTSGICNFPSHMGSLNYGYASVGAWRKINAALYAQIPATDVRKGWWLNEEQQSPNLNDEQAAYVAKTNFPAYTQMKFGCYNDEVYTSTNANDIPLMRVEEMYLILAEAQAMAGDPATGAATLEAFVRAYRDPEYTCAAKEGQELTALAVQEKVWFQRRIELWGEGFSYADMMRLKKDMDRRGAGFEAHTTFLIPTGSDALILPIPQNAMNNNASLVQNPEAEMPEPVIE